MCSNWHPCHILTGISCISLCWLRSECESRFAMRALLEQYEQRIRVSYTFILLVNKCVWALILQLFDVFDDGRTSCSYGETMIRYFPWTRLLPSRGTTSLDHTSFFFKLYYTNLIAIHPDKIGERDLNGRSFTQSAFQAQLACVGDKNSILLSAWLSQLPIVW